MAYQSHHYSATLLCSTCISVFLLTSSWALWSSTLSLHVHLSFLFLFLICIFVLCLSSTLYALCIISILCTTPLLCVLAAAHNILQPAWLTLNRRNHLFYVLCIFIMPNPPPDHTPNSSFSLVILLNLFFISGRYPEILWILWQSQFFIVFANYSQSFLASLASNPLPSCDHRRWPNAYSKGASRSWSSES